MSQLSRVVSAAQVRDVLAATQRRIPVNHWVTSWKRGLCVSSLMLIAGCHPTPETEQIVEIVALLSTVAVASMS